MTLPIGAAWSRSGPGLRPDGTLYAATIRRRCRCLGCGQVRIDKEYL